MCRGRWDRRLRRVFYWLYVVKGKNMIENLEQMITHLNDLNAKGRYAEVIADVTPLIKQDDQESTLYVLQGNALYGLGRLEESAEAYHQGIFVNPNDVNARSNYGSVLFALGRYVDALNACDAALAIDPSFGAAYVNAANCLFAMGHVDLAVFAATQAFSTNEKDPLLGTGVAALLFDFGEYNLARDTYFQVARLPDAPADIHRQIAAFFKNARDNGIDRTLILKDIDAWRKNFQKDPEVFRLAADIIK